MPDPEKEQKSNEEILFEPGSASFEGIHELSVVAEGEERVTWFVWALVACSTISGLLFGQSVHPILVVFNYNFLGYDTGVISGALVTIGHDLSSSQLSNGQKACYIYL